MKSYLKTITRSFIKNKSRFIIIFLITLLGTAFVSGLGNISPILKSSFSEGLIQDNISDLIIKNTETTGFTSSDIETLSNLDEVTNIETFFSIEDEINKELARFYVFNEETNINKLKLISGDMPKNNLEIVVEEESLAFTKKEIGQTIKYMNLELKIVGIVRNPLFFSKAGDIYLKSQVTKTDDSITTLDLAFYTYKSLLPDYFSNILINTDIYLKINTNNHYFSNSYNNEVSDLKEKIENFSNTYKVLTLEDNYSYSMLSFYTDKVDIIVIVFPIFFIAVTALVVLSSMSRMIEEERGIIACYKTLGFSNFKIYLKYLLFSLVSTTIGFIIGVFGFTILIPYVIYPAFDTVFYSPNVVVEFDYTMGIITGLIIVLLMGLLTVHLLHKELNKPCATLLKPKSPKKGKKIFLEYIPFIWHRLSFKYKSSIRNIFRFKGHLFMTVISVAGSTALVFAGIGLFNIASSMEKNDGYVGIKDTLVPVSIIIIIFALLLCMLVVYNLTNMNIKERNKELATLKVLGYYNNETTMYIYREVLMMVIIGIIFGLPLGVVLITSVTELLGFSSISDVKWYAYLLTVICVLTFILIVDLLLLKKIKKIDMNTSLKTVE